jgi:hypothetical protein
MRTLTVALTLLSLTVVPVALADGDGGKTLRGAVAAASDTSITVKDGDRALTCAHPTGAPGAAVGDRVQIACRRGDAGLVLVALKKLDRPRLEKPKIRILEIEGAVTPADAGMLRVQSPSGKVLACAVPTSLTIATGALKAGDRVKAQCGRAGDATPVLLRLKRLVPEGQRESTAVDIAGVVKAVGDSITIANDDRSLTCAVTPTAKTAAATLAVGDRAAMICRDGQLLQMRKKEAEQPVEGAGTTGGTTAPTVQFGFRGTLAGLSPDRIFVTTDGGTRSCFVPEALRAGVAAQALTTGVLVKLACAGPDLDHAQLVFVERV